MIRADFTEAARRRKTHPVVGRETHVVESCLHNSIDTNLLEDGVRRSSTRKDERSNDGPHFFFGPVHGGVFFCDVRMKNSKSKKKGDQPYFILQKPFTVPPANSFFFLVQMPRSLILLLSRPPTCAACSGTLFRLRGQFRRMLISSSGGFLSCPRITGTHFFG